REDLKRRSIALGARPPCKIEGSIWIDAGLSEHRAAEHRLELFIGADILQEGGLNLFPEMPLTKKLAPVQLLQRSAEAHELAQMLDRNARVEPLGLSDAQSVDDDRRVPEPVEKIVGIRIVSREDRRRHHRSRPRDHPLAEAGTLLDDLGRRDGAQHCAYGKARFSLDPALKRGHAI